MMHQIHKVLFLYTHIITYNKTLNQAGRDCIFLLFHFYPQLHFVTRLSLLAYVQVALEDALFHFEQVEDENHSIGNVMNAIVRSFTAVLACICYPCR